MRFLLLALVVSLPVTQAVVQTCSATPCNPKTVTADFTFIIDVSNSLGSQANFNQVIAFLNSFVTGLVLSPEDSQVALYTYAYNAKGYSTLTQGSDLTALKANIQKITYDNTADRNLFAALNKEEAEVTPNSGFRVGYPHILVLISGDSWTGTSVIGSSVLKSVQQKYDMVMAIGVGPNAVVNQGSVLPQFTANPSNVFFSTNYDQLTYVAQWMYNYACPSNKLPTQSPTTTIMPTQSPSVPCSLNSLNYDVYLVVDTSTSLSATDFAALKQTLYDFVKVFQVGNGKTQFALVATSIDSELYFTSFHQSQDRGTLLNTIQTLTQDGSAGQSLLLSLQAIQSAYLTKNYTTANKIVVYFTGTSVWDQDPNAQMKLESTTYGVKPLAVQWGPAASITALNTFTGGSNCVFAATSPTTRAAAATWVQTAMCKKNFCM